MANPPRSRSREAVAEDARRRLIALNRRAPPRQDMTYKKEQQAYFRWVANMRLNNKIPPGNKHITRENVDLYFSREVTSRDNKPETARRILSALQKYADYVEHAGEPQRFVVESNIVRQALECQKRLFQQRLANKVVDPHRNLPTNILSEEDQHKVIRTVLLENRPYWKDLLLSWTGCEQAGAID